MSFAPGPRTKRSVILGFALLGLCLGCSDSGGPVGQGGAGGSAGRAVAGESSGGSSSGAPGHAGQANDCDLQECFVANTCVDRCGGEVVYVGCCACVPPAVNEISCADNE